MSAARPSLLARSRMDTHVEQAVIRLLLTGAVIGALLLHLDLPLSHALAACECLPLLFGYVPAGGLLLAWSLALKRGCARTRSLPLRLGVALVTDVFVAAGFTALGGQYAPISLPVFLAIIVGYGWRFGAGYGFAASVLGLVAFSVARMMNPLFEPGAAVTVGYYICFIAVPLYLLQVQRAPVHAPAMVDAPLPTPGNAAPADTGTTPQRDDDEHLLHEALVDELRATCVDDLMWQVLVSQFEQEVESLLGQLMLAVVNRDEPACRSALHRLRGAAGTIGAVQLEEAFSALERQAPAAPWSSTIAGCRQLAARTVRRLRATT
jgi:HPt (histidine-containing phosphotransfer) domain-containing protein